MDNVGTPDTNHNPSDKDAAPGPPLWLLAELTYRCPLHCAFCYNPIGFDQVKREIDTETWIRTLQQARELGSVQCGFSGGEPLLRDDLEELVGEARQLGYYTNLLTSGVGLNEKRAGALKDAGLDHIQLSFQDSTRELNDFLSNTRTFDLKRRVASIVKDHDWPMVMNCVIHRLNIDVIDKIIDLALELGAETLELANTQYYSWAKLNRDQLLPSREQVEKAEAVTARYRERFGDRIKIIYVVPDYYEKWMQEPCVSCPEQDNDLGGCRCQAYMLTGDISAADPICDKSPHRAEVDRVIDRAQRSDPLAAGEHKLVFREPKASQRLSSGLDGASPILERPNS